MYIQSKKISYVAFPTSYTSISDTWAPWLPPVIPDNPLELSKSCTLVSKVHSVTVSMGGSRQKPTNKAVLLQWVRTFLHIRTQHRHLAPYTFLKNKCSFHTFLFTQKLTNLLVAFFSRNKAVFLFIVINTNFTYRFIPPNCISFAFYPF